MVVCLVCFSHLLLKEQVWVRERGKERVVSLDEHKRLVDAAYSVPEAPCAPVPTSIDYRTKEGRALRKREREALV